MTSTTDRSAALRALVAEHGTAEQLERYDAALLPTEEADAILYGWAFRALAALDPPPARHKRLEPRDVCTARGEVTFTTQAPSSMKAPQFAELKRMKAALPEARIEPRQHIGTCAHPAGVAYCKRSAERLSARVVVAWHGRELVREYAL